MKILLINADGFKNYALEKIKLYHVNRGDNVVEDFPLARIDADKVYISCVFTFNAHKVKQWHGAAAGGSGLDLVKTLPKEIEVMRPKVNFGFGSRGCPRACAFCVVPQKEGKVRTEADVYDIWDGKTHLIELYDNNILALPDHFERLCKQAKKEKIRIDFNQGLDIRLLTKENFKIGKGAIKRLRFAFDNAALFPAVEKGLKIIGKEDALFYVFTGLNTTWADTMGRLEYLKAHNKRAYLMRHESIKGERKYIRLAQWVNQPEFFMKKTFDEFVLFKENGRRVIETETKQTVFQL